MKIQINIEKRHLLLLIAVIAITAIGVAIGMPTTAPNPGHTADQIQCSGCIETANLADNAVTAAKITDGSISKVACHDVECVGEGACTCNTNEFVQKILVKNTCASCNAYLVVTCCTLG